MEDKEIKDNFDLLLNVLRLRGNVKAFDIFESIVKLSHRNGVLEGIEKAEKILK